MLLQYNAQEYKIYNWNLNVSPQNQLRNPKTTYWWERVCVYTPDSIIVHSKGQCPCSLLTVTYIFAELLLIRSQRRAACVIINIPTFVSAVKVSVISLHYACSYNSTVMQWEAVSHIASRFYRPLLFEWNWNPFLNNWKCLLGIVYLQRALQFI